VAPARAPMVLAKATELDKRAPAPDAADAILRI
jgi:hypothetical protein